MYSKNIATAIGVFIAVSLAATSTSTPSAQAAATKTLFGQGIGTVTCPNGSISTGNQINFAAAVDKGRITGGQQFGSSFSIFNPTTFVGAKQGFPTQGHVNPRSYILQGIEDGDSICNASIPTTVLISGVCGQGVTIQFSAANGERGSFTGNAACTG